MEQDEYEFLLEDRIAKIQAINEQYNLENNAYISFNGGKDSTILHYLIDIALPNNHIPRVYANTGIEYHDVVKFVRELQKQDSRFVVLNQNKNIKQTLETYGYPFKSKEHSLRVEQYNKNSNAKFMDKYLYKTDYRGKYTCPKILLYQFEERGKYNYSNKCCYKLKKSLLHEWQKQNKKKMAITGVRNEEGGSRERLTCITGNGKLFHPLIVCSEEWEETFVKNENVKLCKLYYPPYNFARTGCKGCPYSLTLQQDLCTMRRLLPNEYKQCEILWKPVYEEYRRIGYRLKKHMQLSIFDFIEGEQ